MAKVCLFRGCNYNVFGGGFCKFHQWKRPEKKIGLKRSPLKLPNKPIRRISKKRSKQNAQYLKERTAFLEGKLCPITGGVCTEIHHTNGRENDRLLDKKYWLAVSRIGHQTIHAHPKWSREKGFLI